MAEEAPLPEFEEPPLVEVALGVQFRPLFGLRPIELAALRESWRSDYPVVQDQPPVPPAIEQPGPGPAGVHLVVGPALQSRIWFISQDESALVQVQHDRLVVNWRRVATDKPYPRYAAIRAEFVRRFGELSEFVQSAELGNLAITQIEINYINAIEVRGDKFGEIERVLRHWTPSALPLGKAEQARMSLVFGVPGVGTPPVRLYVAVDPGQGPEGRPVYFLTLTIRGAPNSERLEDALPFMDEAHEHIVRSFAQLTPEDMHLSWGRRR